LQIAKRVDLPGSLLADPNKADLPNSFLLCEIKSKRQLCTTAKAANKNARVAQKYWFRNKLLGKKEK
jgi:hypothetical protein